MSKTIFSSLLTLALAAATPTYADTSACQKQLEAAVLKILTSGPMRAEEIKMWPDKDFGEVVEFAPPFKLHATSKGLEKSPYSDFTVIEGTTYSSDKKPHDGMPIPDPIYSIAQLSNFADPSHYWAISCSGKEIGFERFVGDTTETDFAKREAAHKAGMAEIASAFAKAAAAQGVDPSAIIRPPHVMVLDEQGRPKSIRYSSTLYNGKNNGEPDPWTYTFTYDPAIKIEPPK